MGRLNLRLVKFINFLNFNIRKKKLIVEYIYHPSFAKILEKFLELNLIDGFFKDNKNIVIFFKYNRIGESAIKKIENKYGKPQILNWRLGFLKNLKVKKKMSLNYSKIQKVVYLLTTPRGVITTEEALTYKVGGIVFLCLHL